jgi:hypothetical protein
MAFPILSAREDLAEQIYEFSQVEFDIFNKINQKIFRNFGISKLRIDKTNTIEFSCGLGEAEVALKLDFIDDKTLPNFSYRLDRNLLKMLGPMSIGKSVHISSISGSDQIIINDYFQNPITLPYEKVAINTSGKEQGLDLPHEGSLDIPNVSRLFKQFSKAKFVKLYLFDTNIIAMEGDTGGRYIFDPADKHLLRHSGCKCFATRWLHKLWGKAGKIAINQKDHRHELVAKISMPMKIHCEFREVI